LRPLIQFYSDAAFIDQACSINKTATSSLLSSLISSVKSTVENLISGVGDDRDAKITAIEDAVINGALWASGMKWMSIIFEILESGFGFSPMTILHNALKDTWTAILPAVKSGTITNDQIDQSAQAVASSVATTAADMRSFRLIANGAIPSLEVYAAGSKVATSIIGKIIGWTLKAALAAAGLTLAKDIFNKITGHEDAKPTSSGLPTLHPSFAPPTPASTQTILKPNPSYVPEHYNINAIWIESTPPQDFANTLTRWTTSIYPDLKGHEDLITESPDFQRLVSIIQNANKDNPNPYTMIPQMFTNRRQIVDYAIDSIAAQYAQQVKPNNPASI
jgi:hypothetical protein